MKIGKNQKNRKQVWKIFKSNIRILIPIYQYFLMIFTDTLNNMCDICPVMLFNVLKPTYFSTARDMLILCHVPETGRC